MKWHGDKAVFDKVTNFYNLLDVAFIFICDYLSTQECASFPGFVTKFRAANTMMTESSDHVDYENFRHGELYYFMDRKKIQFISVITIY